MPTQGARLACRDDHGNVLRRPHRMQDPAPRGRRSLLRLPRPVPDRLRPDSVVAVLNRPWYQLAAARPRRGASAARTSHGRRRPHARALDGPACALPGRARRRQAADPCPVQHPHLQRRDRRPHRPAAAVVHARRLHRLQTRNREDTPPCPRAPLRTARPAARAKRDHAPRRPRSRPVHRRPDQGARRTACPREGTGATRPRRRATWSSSAASTPNNSA